MNIQEFGRTIKEKYPTYGSYSDEEIGRRMIEKYPQYKDQVDMGSEIPQQSATEGAMESSIYKAPVVGGLIKMIAKPAEKYGRMLGGAGYEGFRAIKAAAGDKSAYVNQDTGQTVENPFLSQEELGNLTGYGTKKRPGGETNTFLQRLAGGGLEASKRTAGAASYVIPGGNTVKGAAAIGGLLGYAGSEGDLGESLLQGGKSAVVSAALTPVMNKGMDIIGKVAKGGVNAITNKLPETVRRRLDIIERQLSDLDKKKMKDLVGYKNMDTAEKMGINTSHMPEDVISMAESKMKETGDEINSYLGKEYSTASLNEIIDAFAKGKKQVVPSMNKLDTDEYLKEVTKFVQQNALDESPDLIAHSGDLAGGTFPIPLSTVDKIKQRVGERYNEDPMYRKIYDNLKKIVEDNSGNPQEVAALHKQYEIFREIRNAAQKQLDRPSANILDYTVRRDKIASGAISDPQLAFWASLAALGATVTPAGAVPGGLFGAYRLIENALRNKPILEKFSTLAEKPKQFAESKAGQVIGSGLELGGKGAAKLLEQLKLRLPAQMINDSGNR